MSNPISKLCANQLPGIFFNSAVSSKGQLAIESRNVEVTFFSLYDLQNGMLLYEIQAQCLTPWHSLAAIDEEGLILSYFENKQNPDQVRFIRYDPNTDQLRDTIDLASINYPTSGIPHLFLPKTEGFQVATQFLGQEIVLGCEYLEQNDLIILCYYLPMKEGFERKLLVLKKGKEVLHDVQDVGMTGFAYGSFFTCQNRLIFVKNKTEINIHEIS